MKPKTFCKTCNLERDLERTEYLLDSCVYVEFRCPKCHKIVSSSFAGRDDKRWYHIKEIIKSSKKLAKIK